MENPWIGLSESNGEFLLDDDRPQVDEHNARVKDKDPDSRIITNTLPEPFIGNPNSARVVLLGLNPGFVCSDLTTHKSPNFRRVLFRNLRHERQDYPFYPLNREFVGTGTEKWWRRRTRQLLEAGVSEEELAERLLMIEWLPYRSKRCGWSINRQCPSQAYSFHLAVRLLEAGRIVIGMRSKKYWCAVDSRFGEIPFLRNPRSTYISRKNAGDDLFERIVAALKGQC